MNQTGRKRSATVSHDIAEILRRDHERLDRILESSADAVRAGRWGDAAEIFEKFRQGIVEGHMAVEESLLFPAFEAWEGDEDHALTALLRKGHRDLQVFFSEMAEAIAAKDAEEFGDLLSTVQTILKQHDAKEEQEVYPHLAAAVPDHGEAAALRILAEQEPRP